MVLKPNKEAQLRAISSTLFAAWGRQHWWPAESRFEVIVGAFLTQNTAWTSVELALAKLRAANVLSLEGIRKVPLPELEQLVRPAGYFRQKAQRLKTFVAFVDEKYEGSLERLFARPTADLRLELLSLNGIGPETADSILLYAGNHEVFVVDAYTRRILARHGILPEDARYEEVRSLWERALTPEFALQTISDGVQSNSVQQSGEKPAGAYHAPSLMSEEERSDRAQLFNETHGLLVGVAKNYCQSRRVLCEKCPLGRFLNTPVRLPERVKKLKVRV